MEKNRAYLVAAPIVVSLICIVLAVNLSIAKSQLNAERARVIELNRQVVDSESQIQELQTRYNEQIRIARELRSSLDTARGEIETLRSTNSDLEARLKEAAEVLAGSRPSSAESIPEATASQ